jgi:hypothetical protein
MRRARANRAMHGGLGGPNLISLIDNQVFQLYLIAPISFSDRNLSATASAFSSATNLISLIVSLHRRAGMRKSWN